MAISLELAISAIRSGRREEGRQLLNLLIQQNPNNEMAWVWMSSVVDTDEQRARCLYHAMAINPGSQLARRGLQVLGIVVSDSRPVKIPRDSQPINIPRPTVPSESSSNKVVTEELPFTPVGTPDEKKIAASPSILQINVEDFITAELKKNPTGAESEVPIPDFSAQPGPGGAEKPPTAGYMSSPEPTKTQQMPSPFLQNKSEPAPEAPKEQEMPPPNGTEPPGPPGQTPAEGMPPTETRPSQPMPVVYPQPNPGGPYYPGLPSGQTIHSNMTMGMPQQPYGQFPSQPMYPGHSNVTMGMPLPPQGGYPPYPAGMMPGMIHSNNTLGMDPYQQPQFQLPTGYHSNSTVLMPSMSEAEARARAGTSHAIPTANAMAMALQNPMPPAMDPGFQAQAYASEMEQEDEEGEELNIVAVIIFGTLSITALGGLGMLILLLFTSPMSSG